MEVHPWVGREVRGIAESELAVFYRPGKIVEVMGDVEDLGAMKVRWQPNETCTSWTSRITDVEFLPALAEKTKFKTGKTSFADLAELRLCLPQLSAKLEPKEQLHAEHIVLGSWLIFKELVRGKIPAGGLPFLLLDNVVNCYITGTSPAEVEGQKRAEQIIRARFRRHGLLGVPICAAGHWTLLVFRRSATLTQVRYYDSVAFMDEQCLAGAQKIVKLLLPDAPELTKRQNQTFQNDSISCGVYALWYWEGEIRQFMGEGWSIGRPFDKEITKYRSRLCRVSEEIVESLGKELAPSKKKKVIMETDDDKAEQLNDVPMQPRYEHQLEALMKDAEKAANQGSVPFYGCPKCRWSRGGCIWWKCNPEKFAAHVAKFPEKYQGKKELALIDEKKLKVAELKEGEFEKL